MKSLIVIALASLLQTGVTEPPGWRAANDRALDLLIAGKNLEVVAIYEKVVADCPKFAEGHLRLGASHESVARAKFGDVALRMKHFETAIVHMRRGLELAGPRPPFDWMRGFIDIHGVVRVDRPDEYERLVRDAVKQYPSEPHAHAFLLELLAKKGEPIDAAARAARAALPKTADARAELAGTLRAAVSSNIIRLITPAAGLKALLDEASSLVDEALEMKPGHADALREKARIEQVRKTYLQ